MIYGLNDHFHGWQDYSDADYCKEMLDSAD